MSSTGFSNSQIDRFYVTIASRARVVDQCDDRYSGIVLNSGYDATSSRKILTSRDYIVRIATLREEQQLANVPNLRVLRAAVRFLRRLSDDVLRTAQNLYLRPGSAARRNDES